MSKRPLLASVALAVPFAVTTVLAAPLLLQAPEPVLKDSEHQKVGKLISACVEAYVAGGKGQFEAEAELLEGLEKWKKKRELDDRPPLAFPADLSRSIWHSFQYSKARGAKKGKVETYPVDPFRTGANEKNLPHFAVWTPAKYNAKESYALVLAIPDAGEDVEKHITEQWTLGDIRDGAILAAVPMPESADKWTEIGDRDEPGGVALTLSVFNEIKDQYAIDFDRVYLAGRGAGVAAAVQLGSMFPDRFAGVIGRSGDVGETGADNFHNLPTYFAGGGSRATTFAESCKADGADNCTLQPEGKEEDVWAWMQANARDPYPAELKLLAGAPFPNKAYWAFTPPSDGSTEIRLDGKIDRASNTITLDVVGARECTLYFNDAMVDLDQPVKVVINGVEHTDSLPRTLRTLTELIYTSGSDPGKVYVASKRYDVAAKEQSE